MHLYTPGCVIEMKGFSISSYLFDRTNAKSPAHKDKVVLQRKCNSWPIKNSINKGMKITLTHAYAL